MAGATYNPTRYSFHPWAKSTGLEGRPPIVFVGVVLLIGWVFCWGSPCAPEGRDLKPTLDTMAVLRTAIAGTST